jgi:hypothetical protein
MDFQFQGSLLGGGEEIALGPLGGLRRSRLDGGPGSMCCRGG